MPDVNLIPKEYKKGKIELSTIFSKTGGIVLILLILSLLLYGGLLLYKSKFNKKLDNLEQEKSVINQSIEQAVDKETKQAIIDLDKNLDTLKGLFENHVYWSRLFSKIEELTVPQAYFSESSFRILKDIEEGKQLEESVEVSLSGNVLSYTILAKQILSFQEESLVKEVKISEISLANEGGIRFNLGIVFSKDILLNHD